jgi:LysR family transcriptional regulator, nitrogen assimilation regulatory protein
MDLRRLEYFVRVAELGSFTRAAAELGVVQSALSRQMRTLESELKQPLLLRNGHGVTLTVAGARLLEHARGILHQVERAREDLMRVDGAPAGRVALGMPPSIGHLLTMPITREFRRLLPGASLCINDGLSASLHEWLLAGRIDIALLYDPLPSRELEVMPLARENLYFVSPVQDAGDTAPVRLEDVAGFPLILPARPNSLRVLVESSLAQCGQRARVTLEMDSPPAIVALVAEGAGHTVLPEYALASLPRPELFTARAIVDPPLYRSLTVATASARTTTLTQETMRELVRRVVGEVFGPRAGPGLPTAAP